MGETRVAIGETEPGVDVLRRRDDLPDDPRTRQGLVSGGINRIKLKLTEDRRVGPDGVHIQIYERAANSTRSRSSRPGYVVDRRNYEACKVRLEELAYRTTTCRLA